MKRLLTLVALAATLTASAQVKVVKLWDNASAPHSNEDAGPQKEKNGNLYNTVDTELFIYPTAPDKATGQAVVVCPGGGYRFVSMPREGHEVGEWLSAEGITVVALKYRLPNGHCQVPLEDAEAALRYIRDHAAEYGVDPSRVGIMGFSAGGHLAASAATMLPEEVRPAFAVLVYPVITAEPGKCHKGSFDNLLGTDRTAGDEAQWSLQNRVTASTPPTLLLLADDDRTVPPVNSTLFYEALKRNGVKGCSLRIYPSGGHGGGFNPDRIYRYRVGAPTCSTGSNAPEQRLALTSSGRNEAGAEIRSPPRSSMAGIPVSLRPRRQEAGAVCGYNSARTASEGRSRASRPT